MEMRTDADISKTPESCLWKINGSPDVRGPPTFVR
jgi:hypothetical protein